MPYTAGTATAPMIGRPIGRGFESGVRVSERLEGIWFDAILPLGKPGVAAGAKMVELGLFHGRSLIEWAAEEALHAGARRIILAAPQGFAPAAAIVRHLRAALRQYCVARGRGTVRILLIEHPVDTVEGWDGVIRAATLRCRGPYALMIDPSMALFGEGLITTFAAFMLRRAWIERGPVPLLAVTQIDWEAALALPVVTGPADRPEISFDRPIDQGVLPVFAGRAMLPLPVGPVLPALPHWPTSAQFPFEPFVRHLLANGGHALQLHFELSDCRVAGMPRSVALSAAPASVPLFQFASRLGLAALQRVG